MVGRNDTKQLIGTMLVGPKEAGLKLSLESLKKCGCDTIHVLVDTLDGDSWELLKEYECKIFSRTWDWEFGPAREFLQQTIPQDYDWQLWLDTDDVIPDATCEKIKDIVASGEKAPYSMPYVYVDPDNHSIESIRVDRDRLFPPDGVHWIRRVHEHSTYPDGLEIIRRADMPILHAYTPNPDNRPLHYIEGLQKDLADMPGDTRTLHYLGQSLESAGKTDEAIETYECYLEAGGWDEERMAACIRLSIMYQSKGNLDTALGYAKQANQEKKHRREAQQRIGEVYTAQKDWAKAYEWFRVAIETPFPEGGMFYVQGDHYRELPYRWLAVPCDQLGKHIKGLEYAHKVLEYVPDDSTGLANVDWFTKQLDKPTIPIHDKGKPTVYFYVGYSSERWNSSAVNGTGIGGRETSNIWMAKEMQNLGWNVILFSDCQGMSGEFDGILNIDYPLFHHICKEAPPDVVFTSIRTTILDTDFPAKLKVFWIHDMHLGNSLADWPDFLTDERLSKFDRFFFMSESQKNTLIPQHKIPDNKSYLTRSGIKVQERFSGDVERNRHRLIFSSSADRGLERLLDYWPEIKERVPEAELHVFYGFLNAIQNAHSRSKEQGDSTQIWVDSLIQRLDSLSGVEYHDRIPQDQLAVEFQKSSVWAYPTHFWETMCLSALEACAAGVPVVATKLAALETTVGEYGTLIDLNPDSPEYREAFINEVVKLLTDDTYWSERSELAKRNIYDNFNEFGTYHWDWKAIAQEWDKYLRCELGIFENAFYQLDDGQAYDYLSVTFNDYMQDKREILSVLEASRKYLGDKVKTIVEIGCGYGANILMLSRLLADDGQIVCIDPEADHVYFIQHDKINTIIPENKWKLIHKLSQSQEALSDLESYLGNKGIDLVFIDGSHEYEDAKADWDNCLPLLNDKAIVIIHDIAGADGCKQLFDELKEDYPFESHIYKRDDIGTGILFVDKAEVDILLARSIMARNCDNRFITDLATRTFDQQISYPEMLMPGEYTIEAIQGDQIDNPELSVIVIAHKQKDERTIPCIESIKQNIGDIKYEIIGVDDGSEDGTSEYFQANVNTNVKLSSRQGICAAVNAGIAEAKAPYVAVIQNDVDLPLDIMKLLLDGLKENSDWGVVVGCLEPWDGLGNKQGNFVTLDRKRMESAWSLYVPGPLRIYKREVIRAKGLYDQYLYNMWEDHDTALAVQSLGYEVGILVEPLFECFSTKSTIQNPDIYTSEEHIRRFLSVYYFHIRWNYTVNANWLLSVEV